jgi:[ribosomal protein S18]-alanine N-acetyltransferase
MAFKIIKDKISVRKADEGDKHRLANLIHFETYVHRHLDWRSPLEWIGYQPFLISERNDQLIGALACPPDPPSTAWIRLFALSSSMSISEGWDVLWQEIKVILFKNNSTKVLAIPLQEWFRNLLKKSNFIHMRDVVVLVWENRMDLPTPNDAITIRIMKNSDLSAIYEIDRSAFDDEWRNSLGSIEVAYRQASLATVAVYDEKIVGYQISTGGSHGGHLARLAVHPDEQMKGIGYSLLFDLLDQFNRRGISRVTVNTQQDNIASLKLYKKANFLATGEIFPVYQYK